MSKEKQREYIRTYVRKHPTRRLWSTAKHRAQTKGIEFSITPDDIIIPDRCPILHIPIEVGAGNQEKGTTYKPYFASVDRVDSTKGYTPDNVRVISFKANSMKRDGTPEELLLLAKWIIDNYNDGEIPEEWLT